MKCFTALILSISMVQIMKCDDWLKSNFKLKTTQKFVNNQNYLGTSLYLPHDKTELNFQIDLNFDETLIADKKVFNWGVLCD